MELNIKTITCIELICLFIIHAVAHSQKLDYLEGVVLNNNSGVEDVHITNIASAQSVTTNEEGAFRINAKVGDSLVISHVTMKKFVFVIKRGHLEAKPFIVSMDKYTIELDEVEINQYPNINAVSLGIIPKKIEKLTQNERKLHTAGDFKPIHLLSLLGGSLELDPIINKISGRTKKIKKYIELDQKRENIQFLKSNYYTYMVEDLKLPDKDIGLFLYYLVDQPTIQDLVDENHDARIKFFYLRLLD